MLDRADELLIVKRSRLVCPADTTRRRKPVARVGQAEPRTASIIGHTPNTPSAAGAGAEEGERCLMTDGRRSTSIGARPDFPSNGSSGPNGGLHAGQERAERHLALKHQVHLGGVDQVGAFHAMQADLAATKVGPWPSFAVSCFGELRCGVRRDRDTSVIGRVAAQRPGAGSCRRLSSSELRCQAHAAAFGSKDCGIGAESSIWS